MRGTRIRGVDMRTTPTDIAWAAGLFEGEGCFTVNGGRGHGRAQVAMTDEDVIRRFADIMGWYQISSRINRPNTRRAWRVEVSTFEGFQATVAMFWPWLGQRRRARAKQILLGWPNRLRPRLNQWAERNKQGYAA